MSSFQALKSIGLISCDHIFLYHNLVIILFS